MFHYKQCLLRNLSNFELRSLYLNENNFKITIRKIIALPLLHIDQIIGSYREIIEELRSGNHLSDSVIKSQYQNPRFLVSSFSSGRSINS